MDKVNDLAVTLDGQNFISVSSDNSIRTWNAFTGKMQSKNKFDIAINKTAALPDGRRSIIGTESFDYTFFLFDHYLGRKLRLFAKIVYALNSIAISPNGQLFYSVFDCKYVSKWDTFKGKMLRSIVGHSGQQYEGFGIYAADTSSIAVAPDGQRVVSAYKEIKIWDSLLNEKNTIEGYTPIAITPDGEKIISSSADHQIIKWNLQTGYEERKWGGHSDEILDIAISHDGRYVLSASQDYTLKVWNLETGSHIANFRGDNGITSCAISPKGTISVGDEGGNIYFLVIENVAFDSPIITAWRQQVHKSKFLRKYSKPSIAFGCPYCQEWCEIQDSALGKKHSCSNCSKEIILNPFTTEGDWKSIAKAWKKNFHG